MNDITNYAKGARLERELKAQLEKDGYTCVRAAGSHGMFDLVAWNERKVMLIQCKTRKPSKKEMAELCHLPCPDNFTKLWAHRENRKKWIFTNATQGNADFVGGGIPEVVPV